MILIKQNNFQTTIFLITLLITGCTLQPISKEKRELYSEHKMQSDLTGKIEVEKEPEVILDYSLEQIKALIIQDFQFSGKKYIENEDGPILHFKFQKCEDTGYSPTKSKGANIAIHWATVFLWPIWTYKTCKATLSVLDAKTRNILKEFESKVDAKDGGQLFIYLFFPFETDADGIRELASRRLIQQYQNSTKSP